MKRKYEIVYIFDSALEEPEINEHLDRFHALLKSPDQSEPITDMAHWGKRTLAYPIKKKEVGYYVVAHVETDTELLSEFERIVKLDEAVMRYLVVINEGLPATRPDQTESESPSAAAASSGDERKEGAKAPVVGEAPAQETDEAPKADDEEGQQPASADETPKTEEEVEEAKQPVSTDETPKTEEEVEEAKQPVSTDEGGE